MAWVNVAYYLTLSTKRLFLYIGVAVCLGGFGQNTTKITVFQPNDSSPTSTDIKNKKTTTHNIKWNYSLLSRGVFLFNYEFLVNEKLTSEVGFGLTYRDFVFEASQTIRSDLNYFENYDLIPSIRYALEGGIRFYPKGNSGFEGVYISPAISYRIYQFEINPEHSSYYTYLPEQKSFKPGYNFFDLQFKFGYQYESWWNYDFVSDFYTGFCLRNVAANYYEETTAGNSILRTGKKMKEKFPQVLFGLKIGVPF